MKKLIPKLLVHYNVQSDSFCKEVRLKAMLNLKIILFCGHCFNKTTKKKKCLTYFIIL